MEVNPYKAPGVLTPVTPLPPARKWRPPWPLIGIAAGIMVAWVAITMGSGLTFRTCAAIVFVCSVAGLGTGLLIELCGRRIGRA